jgi:hypothetical protein
MNIKLKTVCKQIIAAFIIASAAVSFTVEAACGYVVVNGKSHWVCDNR